MLPNVITLQVDILNNATLVEETLTRQEEIVNRSTYRGTGHTLQGRNIVQFYRTLAKRSGNFLGAAKTEIKLTTDKVVLGADGLSTVSPLIGSISFSVPIGVSAADQLALRQRMIALLDDDAVMGPLMVFQEI